MDVNALFQQAVAAGASDIHIEPLDEFVRIRWRKDGVLHTAGRLPRQRLDSLVSRIKVLAGLDIANRRLPQDGRIVWHEGSRRLDLRISTLPTVRGEKIVVRILDGKRMPLELSALGMDGEARACLEKLVWSFLFLTQGQSPIDVVINTVILLFYIINTSNIPIAYITPKISTAF